MQLTYLSLSLKVKVITIDFGSTIRTLPFRHPTARYLPLFDILRHLAGKSNLYPSSIVFFFMSQHARKLSSPTVKY